MIIHVAKSRYSSEVEHISFPAEAAKVRSAILALEEFGGYSPAQIIGGEGFAQKLVGRFSMDDLFSEDGIGKLNRLSNIMDSMDQAEQDLFAGILSAEHIKDSDGLLRAASKVGQYELIAEVSTDRELGEWLVKHGHLGTDISDTVLPYLDYPFIGAQYYKSHEGAYTPNGYVRLREPEQTQKEGEKAAFTLTLASPTANCRIGLPASDERLEAAKKALGLDSLESAVIGDMETSYPWAYLLPMDSITLEDANTLAQYVQQMSERELRLYGAALEVEEPDTFADAICIAEDLDDYEAVYTNEGEYGRDALRLAGAGDEIFELLDGFTDFDALGRSEMEQDGVRETSFGSIKRLSAPFPQPDQEIGQTMC